MVKAYIKTIDRSSGLSEITLANRGQRPDNSLPGIEDPVDPGYGIEGGEYPDHGLPGGPNRPGRPPHPGNRPPGSGNRPVDPGYGRPGGGGGEHPGHRPPWAGKPKPEWPPGPTDPDWGVDAPVDSPEHPIHLPGTPDNSLPGEVEPGHPIPPVAGHPMPPDMPPGTIWPPLPPDAPTGNHKFLVWIQGVGLRYGSFVIPEHETDPGYGVGEGGSPDQGLPGEPAAPGQLPSGGATRPGVPRPPVAGQQPQRPPTGAGATPSPQPLKR
jgi:hypothetical protein